MEKEFRMNLQLFAEPADGEGTAGAENNGQNGQEAQQGRHFTQEDVDRIVNQRLARQQRDTEARIARAREEARTEAERLAAMTQEQRIQHEREQNERSMQERENGLAAREAEIARRELRAEAIETLISRGLPRELEQVLNYSNAEACNRSIDAVEKAFRDSVQAEVNKQLSGNSAELRRSTGSATKAPGVQLAEEMGREEAQIHKAANEIIDRYR